MSRKIPVFERSEILFIRFQLFFMSKSKIKNKLKIIRRVRTDLRGILSERAKKNIAMLTVIMRGALS